MLTSSRLEELELYRQYSFIHDCMKNVLSRIRVECHDFMNKLKASPKSTNSQAGKPIHQRSIHQERQGDLVLVHSRERSQDLGMRK